MSIHGLFPWLFHSHLYNKNPIILRENVMNPSIILSENFLEYPEVSSERERPPVVTGMFYPPVVKHTESWEIRTMGVRSSGSICK